MIVFEMDVPRKSSCVRRSKLCVVGCLCVKYLYLASWYCNSCKFLHATASAGAAAITSFAAAAALALPAVLA